MTKQHSDTAKPITCYHGVKASTDNQVMAVIKRGYSSSKASPMTEKNDDDEDNIVPYSVTKHNECMLDVIHQKVMMMSVLLWVRVLTGLIMQ